MSEKTSYVDHASIVDGQCLFILDFNKFLGLGSFSRPSSMLLVEVFGISFLLRVEQLSQVYSAGSGSFKERSHYDSSHISGYFVTKQKTLAFIDLSLLSTKIPK